MLPVACGVVSIVENGTYLRCTGAGRHLTSRWQRVSRRSVYEVFRSRVHHALDGDATPRAFRSATMPRMLSPRTMRPCGTSSPASAIGSASYCWSGVRLSTTCSADCPDCALARCGAQVDRHTHERPVSCRPTCVEAGSGRTSVHERRRAPCLSAVRSLGEEDPNRRHGAGPGLVGASGLLTLVGPGSAHPRSGTARHPPPGTHPRWFSHGPPSRTWRQDFDLLLSPTD